MLNLKNPLRYLVLLGALWGGSHVNAQSLISFPQTTYLANAGQSLSIAPQVPGPLVGAPLNCSESGGLPPGLNLNSNTCEISGVVPLGGLPPGDTFFTVQMTSPYLSSPVAIKITAIENYVIQFSGSPFLALAGQNVRFAPTTVTGLPLNQALNCRISSGSLPPGLSLDPVACAISGTIPLGVLPPQTVQFPIAIASPLLLNPLSLTIWASDKYAVSFSSTSFQIQAGQAVNIAPTTSGFAVTQPLNCNFSGSLPPGLTFNSSACSISGTIPLGALPPQTVQFPISVMSQYLTSPINFTLWASDQYVIAFSSSSFQLQAGQAVNIAPTTSGFAPNQPLNCNLSGSLPPGLTFNSSACSISGTIPYGALPPQTVQIPVSITSQFLSSPVNFTLWASDQYVISFSAPSYQLNTGSPISIAPSTSGFGAGQPLNCSLASGSLPPGLTLVSSTCTLSGTIPSGSIPAGGLVFQFTLGSQYLSQPIALTILATL